MSYYKESKHDNYRDVQKGNNRDFEKMLKDAQSTLDDKLRQQAKRNKKRKA